MSTSTSLYYTPDYNFLKDRLNTPLPTSTIFRTIEGDKNALMHIAPTSEMLFTQFDSKDLLRSNGGTLVATLSGGASVADRTLKMNNAISQWTYNPAGMVNATPVSLTFRMKFIPKYSGTPPVNQGILREHGTSSTRNMIEMRHLTSTGNLTVVFRNSTGAGQGTLTAIAGWNPVADQEYEIELNLDAQLGEARLFLDGVQQGGTHPNVYFRDNNLIEGYIGSSSLVQNFEVKDFQKYYDVQHTALFTPGLFEYPLTEEKINPISCPGIFCFNTDGLEAFSAVVDETGGSVGFLTNIDEVDMYWDGLAWVASDGTLAQSNTAAVINTNAAALDLSLGVELHFTPILKSNDGSATPSISSQTVSYSFYADLIDPTLCEVYGYVFDNGIKVEGAIVTFKSRNVFDVNSNFISIDKTITSDINGYFALFLVKSEAFDEPVDVVISFTNSLGAKIERELTMNVPDLARVALEDTIV